jgi:gluconolactonase
MWQRLVLKEATMHDKDIVVENSSMKKLLAADARLERLWTGAKWAEGPVYFHEDDSLVWSDVPNNRMFKWTRKDGTRLFRAPSQFANGNYRDLQGRLVTCEHLGRRISRTEADGNVITLVGHYNGKRLNSPNDLTVKTDGTIWFSDPNYGIMSNDEGYMAPSEIGSNNVYRFDPISGEVSVVAVISRSQMALRSVPTRTSCTSPIHRARMIRTVGTISASSTSWTAAISRTAASLP